MGWRVRGRPKVNKATRDFGTVELQQKRLMRATDDALDLVFEKGIITETQYYAGLKLRKFFHIIFGFLKVRAYDISNIRGRSTKIGEYEEEKSRIKKDYDFIIRSLAVKGYDRIINRICIHGEILNCLKIHQIDLSQGKLINKRLAELEELQEAMIALEKIIENQKIYTKINNKIKNYVSIQEKNLS